MKHVLIGFGSLPAQAAFPDKPIKPVKDMGVKVE